MAGMAQLTPKQFAAKIKAKINAIERENLPLKIAAQTVHALRVKRIFHDGLSRGLRPIGRYDTKRELWVADDKLRRAGNHEGKPFGIGRTYKSGKKKGQQIFWRKAGNKTTYFKNYLDLKRKQGFDATVNLRLTNNFQSDFANTSMSRTSDAIPKVNTIKISPNHYLERLDRSENVKKREGFEEKYGKVFNFSSTELKLFKQVFAGEMNKLLSK